MFWNSVDSQQWLVVAVAFGLVEAALQLWVLASFPFSPIGDEVEYIERGRAGRSFRPEPFLRVPFLPAVAWLGGRTGHTTLFLRLISIFFSSTAMAATAGAATLVGGSGIAAILCVCLFLVPERIVLGSRIWPDVYLAAATSGIALVISLSPSIIDLDRSAAIVGVLVATATLIRLDALILVPSVATLWALVGASFSPAHAGWTIGLPLTVFAAWWLVSGVVLRQRWPDDTWRFNLGITVQESLVQAEGGPVTIDDLIERHQRVIRRRQNDDPTLTQLDRATIHWAGFVCSAAARLRAMVGPDTFVHWKILAEFGKQEHSKAGLVFSALLRISVPFLLAATIGLFALRPTGAGWLAIPALSLLVPAVLFHARTRYRLPLIYGLIPVAAGSIGQILAHHPVAPTPLIITVALTAAILGCVLAREPRRMERS